MAPHHRGGVPVEIGGRQLVFRYSLGSMATLQKRLGLPDFPAILALLRQADGTGHGDLATLQAMLWAGFLHMGDAAPSFDAVGEMIEDLPTLTVAIDAMGEALTAFIAGPEGMRRAAEAAQEAAAPADPPEASPAS